MRWRERERERSRSSPCCASDDGRVKKRVPIDFSSPHLFSSNLLDTHYVNNKFLYAGPSWDGGLCVCVWCVYTHMYIYHGADKTKSNKSRALTRPVYSYNGKIPWSLINHLSFLALVSDNIFACDDYYAAQQQLVLSPHTQDPFRPAISAAQTYLVRPEHRPIDTLISSSWSRFMSF